MLFKFYKSNLWKFDISVFNGYISINTVSGVTSLV